MSVAPINEKYDGYCVIHDMVIITMKEKTLENKFGSTSTWNVNVKVVSTVWCEPKDSYSDLTVLLSNEATDSFVEARYTKSTICTMCDTNCPTTGNTGVYSLRRKGASTGGGGGGGFPPEFRRLRDALNGQCYEKAGKPMGSESLRNKIGPNNRTGEECWDDMVAGLSQFVDFEELATIFPDCEDVSCGCAGDDPPQVFGLVRNPTQVN